MESKLTPFQIYSETELACKYPKSLSLSIFRFFFEYMKTGKLILNMANPNQNREIEKFCIPVRFYRNNGNIGEKAVPENQYSSRLQELYLMKTRYSRAIHYDIHFDMKLHYTKSRIFQEMSLSELETLHHYCELNEQK